MSEERAAAAVVAAVEEQREEREAEELTLRRYHPAQVLAEIAHSQEPLAGRPWASDVNVPFAHSKYNSALSAEPNERHSIICVERTSHIKSEESGGGFTNSNLSLIVIG